MEKQQLIKLFDQQVNRYDKNRGNPKQKRFRQNLLSHAEGQVLELAVGAGANFPYYPPGVKVTAVDFSERMIEKAQLAAKYHRIDAEFICSDIEEIDFPKQSFNTIVSTLSMCGYYNPLKVLDQISSWCKPEGKILLIEHGLSSNLIVSTFQKFLNPLSKRLQGCHLTRNILELIRESGIQIDKVESYMFHSFHLIWAKPKDTSFQMNRP